MQRAVICKGDNTSHGGKVLAGRPTMTIDGRPVAQRGHNTFCPQCKGTFPIIEGVPGHTHHGVATAVEGMKTACGATLIASQHQVTIDIAPGAGAAHGGEEANAVAMPPPEADASQPDYSGVFRAVDRASGKPVAGMPYKIGLPDGSVLRGTTDADGYTQRITRQDPAKVELHWEPEHQSDAEACDG